MSKGCKDKIAVIILYNKMISRAILDKRFNIAEKYLLRLHKLEIRDRVQLGTYRLKIKTEH